MSFMR